MSLTCAELSPCKWEDVGGDVQERGVAAGRVVAFCRVSHRLDDDVHARGHGSCEGRGHATGGLCVKKQQGLDSVGGLAVGLSLAYPWGLMACARGPGMVIGP